MLFRFIPHIHQLPSVWGSWKRAWSISKFGSFPGLWRRTNFCCGGLIGQDRCQRAAFSQALFSSWCWGDGIFALPVFWTARLPLLSRGLGGNGSAIWQWGFSPSRAAVLGGGSQHKEHKNTWCPLLRSLGERWRFSTPLQVGSCIPGVLCGNWWGEFVLPVAFY